MSASAIAGILQRAKAAIAAPVDARIVLTKRVRPIDRSCAGGYFVSDVDGWVFWLGDDGFDHLSRPDYIEPETA